MVKTINILIIDDEEVVISAVKRILQYDENFKYFINSANSAEEGLNKALQNTPDVIISDIVMPGTDGMELLKKLMEMNLKSKIIMFTGYATMKTALLALKMGAFDFIAKPFTGDELCGSIHRAVRKESKKVQKKEHKLEEKNVVKTLDVYSIPGYTWAKVMEDFSVVIGIDKEFLNSISKIEKLELLKEGDQTDQGQGFGKISCKDKTVHTLPSPLSGRILALNKQLINNIQQIYEYSDFEEWIIHIDPADFEKEISNLILL